MNISDKKSTRTQGKNISIPSVYIAIDAKSFYASVECMERHLDPLTTNLVVANTKRTEKTICLAVSPSLKAVGVPGRPRLFEVIQKVKEVNQKRLASAIRSGHVRRNAEGNYSFASASFSAPALAKDPTLELGYIVAPPRMRLYEEYSTKIYSVYLKFFAPEDIIVYSIDEVFINAGPYISTYGMTPHELTMTVIREVLYTTGITATAGIGTNLYLAKIAMDIVAKKVPADKDGVRIAELDEMSYRRILWTHEPLTDFWRIGRGISKKLEANGLYTMGDIARCSLGKKNDPYNEDLLYKLFGISAELIIDHAWGWEPVTVDVIKSYKPSTTSLSSGQVLPRPYDFDDAKMVTWEMTENLVYDLLRKGLATKKLVLTIGYDRKSLEQNTAYTGPVSTDHYGRAVPKHAHGTGNIDHYTNSNHKIVETMMNLFDSIVDRNLLVRRIGIAACLLLRENDPKVKEEKSMVQLDMFTDYAVLEKEKAEQAEKELHERNLQKAILDIKDRYGKNALLKATNLMEGATAKERNASIGGHQA